MKTASDWTPLDFLNKLLGGDEEDRTPDLRIANATLSQLSYVPGTRFILSFNFPDGGYIPPYRLAALLY